MLHIRTLGTSAIVVGDERIGPEQAMAFTLLLLLGMRGQPIARRELSALLWPDAANADRNHRLRSLLHRLRRRHAPLVCSGATVSLIEASLDFREFLSTPASVSDVRLLAPKLGAVLSGMVTPNAEIADHLEHARDVIVATVMRWITAAFEIARAAGDWTLLRDLAIRAREVDPLNTAVSLILAEAHCLTGDLDLALATLDGITDNGEDSEITKVVTLRRRIMRTAERERMARRKGESPFVGRDDLMRRIWGSLARAKAGTGGAICLWGPAGIGKTRIIEELGRSEITDAYYLRLAARPVYALRPMELFVDVAFRLLDAPGAAGCEPAAYATLRQNVSAATPNDHARGSRPPERAIVDAFVELLAAITDETPLVLAIDDMQVTDVAVWRQLRPMIRWSADRRILWLFAQRASREAELARVTDESAIVPLRVRSLDRSAAMALLRAIGAKAAAVDHEHAFEIAGGNPLLLQDIARAGAVAPEHTLLIDDALARLPADALRVMRLIASLGGHATPQTLSELGYSRRSAMAMVLGELERAGMIREEEGVLHAHTAWSDAVLATLTASEHAAINF